MKHIINSIQYKGLDAYDWFDMEIVPALASMEVSSGDTANGRVLTYSVSATIKRVPRVGEASLDQEMILRVSYDNGRTIDLGTPEMPVRLSVRTSDVLSVSTTWKTRPGLVR